MRSTRPDSAFSMNHLHRQTGHKVHPVIKSLTPRKPPSKDPNTPRIICRPTVLPIVRAALFTAACSTVSPRREPPEPSTPPSAAPADSSHPPPDEVPAAAPPPATPPAGI